MAITNPTDTLTHIMAEISRHRRKRSNALLADAGIHAGQDVLLYHLWVEDGQLVSSLVEKMNVKPATVSTMVDRMVAIDLVKKRKGTIDKRTARIFLTAKGREAIKEIEEVWDATEEQATKGLSVIEKFMLKRLLNRVLLNVSQ